MSTECKFNVFLHYTLESRIFSYIGLCCCQIQLYSLFTKTYIISRTTKIPGTFKFLTYYQTCNKVQSYLSYSLSLSSSSNLDNSVCHNTINLLDNCWSRFSGLPWCPMYGLDLRCINCYI